MTRLASILGVATVATLVLLSGCETPMKTDYAKDLAATWTVSDLDTMVTHDLDGPGPNPEATFPAKADVEVAISAGDKLNTGDFSVKVTHTIPAGAPLPPQDVELPPITATGSIVVDSKTIKVKVDDIDAGPVTLPAEVQALEGQDIDIGYTVTDESLVISSTLLAALQVAPPTDPKLTLTKQ